MTPWLYLASFVLTFAGLAASIRASHYKDLAEDWGASRHKYAAKRDEWYSYVGLIFVAAGLAAAAGVVSFLVNTFVR